VRCAAGCAAAVHKPLLTPQTAATYPRARMSKRFLRVTLLASALAGIGLTSSASPARAEDPPLVLMGSPTSFTDVADAFDDDDPFDLNLSLTFERSQTSGTIQQEAPSDLPGAQRYVDVAEARSITNKLVLGLEAGIYHDLMIYAHLPLILSDDRSLRGVTGGVLAGEVAVPFVSPTRSGVDTINLGMAWSITNQFRTPWLPTWVVMVEGRFAVGAPLRACSATALDAGGGNCRQNYGADGAPSYFNGDGGISRGTNALRIETRSSHRYRYLEPYAGLAFQVEWPASSDRFFVPSGDLDGVVNSIPPLFGEATVGVVVIPWEQRARHQRFSIDFRGTFAYISEGRNWSPLFDALGTSSDPALTNPVCETSEVVGEMCPMGDPARRKGFFYGLTDTQSHARIGGRIAVEMQAARYVKFGFAAGLSYTTAHLLSFADACNPNIDQVSPGLDADGNVLPDARGGNCRSGVINPNYRETIDLPGRRFRLDGAMTFDLSATITAQF